MEWNRYYVERNKMRTDGDIDHETKECYTEASAKSQYSAWESSAYTDTTYPYISIVLLDWAMIPVKHICVPTSYVAPVTEAEETASSEA